MKLYVTELIGTFFLTLVVALSGGNPLAPLAIGAVLMVMIYAGGYISGAHYNPAVSMAVALTRSFGQGKMRGYLLAQLIGSVSALLIAQGMTGVAFAPAPTGGILFAPLFAEILFTFVLCYTVLHTAIAKESKGNQYYGVAIGMVLLIAATVAGPISGAVLNPAIGTGAFIVSLLTKGAMPVSSLLLYIVGPTIGAVLAATAYGIQKN